MIKSREIYPKQSYIGIILNYGSNGKNYNGLFQETVLWYLNKIPWQNTVFKRVPRKWGPPGPDPNPSRYAGATRTSRAWNVSGSKYVRAGHPIDIVWVSSHWVISATRDIPDILHLGWGSVPLLPQGAWPTWTETSRRPPIMPQSFVNPSPVLSPIILTDSTGWTDLPYFSDISTCHTRSLRPLPMTLPHWQLLVEAK